MPIYDWFDSDDEKDLPGICYESEQGFDQASQMNDEKFNLKDESQQVNSETESESGSDEFDVSGYYVGKKIKPGVYEFSDSSVPFSGFGIVLEDTESESSSYDSDVTSKPSCFGDEFNDDQEFDQACEMNKGGDNYKANLEIEPEHVETESESGSDEFDASGYYVGKKVRPRVYEFSDSLVPFSGFGIVLESESESESESSSYDSDATSKSSVAFSGFGIELKETETAERLESRCIEKRRNVLGMRDFPIGCGTSLPCIKKSKVSGKRDSPAGCESIESGITRRSVSGKRRSRKRS